MCTKFWSGNLTGRGCFENVYRLVGYRAVWPRRHSRHEAIFQEAVMLVVM